MLRKFSYFLIQLTYITNYDTEATKFGPNFRKWLSSSEEGWYLRSNLWRNLSIFNNMICVPILKVLPMGMSNHPNLEIFRTSSKIWQIRIFFQNSKFHVRKNCCWCHQWDIYQKKFWRKKNSKIPKFSRQKWVECEIKFFLKHYLPIVSWK